MNTIRIVVNGALGKMGKTLTGAFCSDPETQVVGAIELKASENSLSLPDNSGTVPFSSDVESIINTCKPDVVVDFSNAKATMPLVRTVLPHKVNMVIGTTGLSADDRGKIGQLAVANKTGVVMAPNFALGAVLMIHLSKIAGKYLDYAEIIKLHHDQKVDAPSGTARSTALEMAAAKNEPFKRPPPEKEETPPSRGEQYGGISVHSVRLPGLIAHQEVILGTSGQTLTIRHDTINRDCYIPGVMLAVKKVIKQQGLIYGLDTLLDL